MANLDFAPLYKSSVGFDHLPDIFKSAARISGGDTDYPPYDIEKLGDDEYRIVVALAGFVPEDIDVTVEQNQLTLRGKKQEAEGVNYLHRGIASASFVRRFELADFIKVNDASFEDGLLVITLNREIPERLKPRQIEINSGRRKKSSKHSAA